MRGRPDRRDRLDADVRDVPGGGGRASPALRREAPGHPRGLQGGVEGRQAVPASHGGAVVVCTVQ